MELHRHSQGSGRRKGRRGRGAAADAAAPTKRTLDSASRELRATRRRGESGRGRETTATRASSPEETRARWERQSKPHAPSIVYQPTLERAKAAKQRQQKEREARLAARRQLQAAALKQAKPKLPTGRPRASLDPPMARAVLDALAAGTSFRQLAEWLKGQTDPQGRPYPHSREWLAARHQDGQLGEWAGQ